MTAPLAHSPQNRAPLVTDQSLAVDFAHLSAKITEISDAAIANVPPVVEDDEDLEKVTASVKTIRAEVARIAEIGKGETDPYYHAHKTAHAFFSGLVTRLTSLQTVIEARGNAYMQKKKAAEQKRLADIERAKREEADRLQREALAKQQANAPAQQVRETMQAATAAHVHADSAAVAAAAPAADLTRTKTAAGTASLSDGTIVGTISDWNKIDWNMIGPHVARADAEKAICAFFRANKEIVKQMIKDGKTIAGVLFTIDQKGTYR